MILSHVLVYGVLFFRLASSPTAAQQTVSIQALPAYVSQRTCAIGCFSEFESDGPPETLAEELFCDTSIIVNDCFCRSDLQPIAVSTVSACVVQACTDTVDASIATSIYNAYCTGAGYTADAAAITESSGTPNSPVTVTVAIETVTVNSGQQRLLSPMEAIVQAAGYRR